MPITTYIGQIISLVALLVIPLTSTCQHTISGKILDVNLEPLMGVTLHASEISESAISDLNGSFSLVLPDRSEYRIHIAALGYVDQQIIWDKSIEDIVIIMEPDNYLLDEVVILGKSDATIVREQAYAVEVVESKEFKNVSTNANDILSRISGVNIRQSGGVGSDFSLSLNGLSGNQVRVFLDGVPMDYFGSSLSLNNFSANIIDQIEVYKGVVPIHLSADALGGAINVTTNSKTSNYLDASYSIGSFGTHIASLNTQYRQHQSGLTSRFKSFYNTSRNNYKVPVNLVNFDTGKEDPEATWVERFHDAYNSKMAWGEIGYTATSFADQLMLGIIYSDNYNELQQATNAVGQAKIPYGEVATEEKKIIGNFTYNKRGLLSDKLSLRSYVVAVSAESLSRDTASIRYDWFGDGHQKIDNTTGEIENRKTLLTLYTSNYLANINTEYQINKSNSITFNYSLNHLQLSGEDPFKNQNNTQFSQPSQVSKQVWAASYTISNLDDKLKSTLFSKFYEYHISSIQTNYGGTEEVAIENQKRNIGIGLSTTYHIGRWQIKASYERATRFPEIIELFGDGLNTVPSPTLTPELSHNVNVGSIYKNQSIQYPLLVSINVFRRDARDFIIPVVQGIKVHHINNGQVLSKGFDLGFNYGIKDHWILSAAGTYLDLRDNNRWRNGQQGIENTLYKVRLPNVPYLFGNLSISYRDESLFGESDAYSISFRQNYVHEFYYRWENLASSDKGIILSQLVSNLELVYSTHEDTYNASLSVNNLWNAKVYDNFQQLRPGRHYNFKLRYFIN